MPDIEIATTVRVGLAIGRALPWKRIVPSLAAKLLGAIQLEADPCRKDFYGGREVVYTMTQVFVRNATGVDVEDAGVRLRWRRRGGREYDGWDAHGIWCKKVASGLASYPEGIEEHTDLPSNGDERHLGLAVKSARTGDTYLVCTETHFAGPRHPNYEHPQFMLQAGVYDVDAFIRGRGGKTGLLRLEATYAGKGTDLIVLER